MNFPLESKGICFKTLQFSYMGELFSRILSCEFQSTFVVLGLVVKSSPLSVGPCCQVKSIRRAVKPLGTAFLSWQMWFVAEFHHAGRYPTYTESKIVMVTTKMKVWFSHWHPFCRLYTKQYKGCKIRKWEVPKIPVNCCKSDKKEHS